MAAGSRFSKVLALRFDEKFIRTWEYYFGYGEGAFKSGMLKYYQGRQSQRHAKNALTSACTAAIFCRPNK
ncbi:hypothetical protein COLO4_30350 [Corchorus olitorius]|uniref:Uncharacterized protein n=1 Tax=Corchorus olitorius TaxID=93759 RepID=A0A1R3H981_9ROSI|nr:hypothetical protein COLO4_30350 [Corchorus olitorius]